MAKALFPIGNLFITPGALDACALLSISAETLLARHMRGDWSEMCRDDQRTNEAAIKDGSRIFSAYQHGDVRFYVITEDDRSSTTILLPSEY